MPRAQTAQKAAASAPPISKPKFVTVACKIPCGLEIYLNRKEEYDEETMTGSRKKIRWVPTGKATIIRGPAQPNGQAPRGYVRPIVVADYALTPGVDADWFEQWMDQNKHNPLVTGGMIYALGKDKIRGWAKENEKRTSGLEPINPDGDYRMPKSLQPAVGKIEPTPEMKERMEREAEGEDYGEDE